MIRRFCCTGTLTISFDKLLVFIRFCRPGHYDILEHGDKK